MSESIEQFVKRSLGAGLNDESFEKIMNVLAEEGVISPLFLTEDIIDKNVLVHKGIPLAQVNMLLVTRRNDIMQGNRREHQTAPAQTNEQYIDIRRNQVPLKINYESTGLKVVLDSQNKLSAERYRLFVHEVWSQIQEKFGSTPGIILIRRIVAGIATDYPQHFRDTLNGIPMLSSRELTEKIEAHRVYKNGVNTDKRAPKRRSSDTVGTEEFVGELPDGETAETQEETKRQLQELKDLEQSTWDNANINEKMITLYATLRSEINGGKTVALIQEEWPFFFHYDVFIAHFRKLTKVDPEQTLNNFLTQKLDSLISYFTTFSKKHRECSIIMMEMRSAVHSEEHQPKLLAILKMITTYLAPDDFTVMFLTKEQTTSNLQLEADNTLPPTPLLIGLGPNEWVCKEFCLMIENRVVQRLKSLEKAVLMMFVAYWNINLQYPTKLNSTMDFIQRFIIDINPPDRGTKCSKKGKSAANDLRLRVINLSREIEEFINLEKSTAEKFNPLQ